MKIRLFFSLLLATAFTLIPETQVSLSTSDTVATIGDRITLKIIVKTTSDIERVTMKDRENPFESLSKQVLPGRKASGFTVFEIHQVISFFSTGNHTLGPFTVQMVKNSRVAEEKKTNSLDITIKSVLEESDKDIKDLRNLVSIRGNPFYILKYVFILMGLTALVITIILLIRKRRRQGKAKPESLLSPLRELEEAVNELYGKNWIKTGRLKGFFIAITDILKHYLHREFGFNAQDLTTEETLEFINRSESSSTAQRNFHSLFTRSDLVKFAKYRPDSGELDATRTDIDSIIAEERVRTQKNTEETDVSTGE